MDFLLECIGFPPDHPFEELVEHVRTAGEAAPWRGGRRHGGEHLRLPLSEGLELRLDREEESELVNLWPHFAVPHRLRVSVERLTQVPDSPFDILLHGIANPLLDGEPDPEGHSYRLCTYLTDARRLPPRLPGGHVLAVSVAGFALDVAAVVPNDDVRDAAILERPRGAWFRPLGHPRDPGGCMEVSLRVREVKRVVNPITGIPVDVIEADSPGRPTLLFVSKWQLEQDGLSIPRPGWRVEGSFLFTGRLAGGLPRPKGRASRHFG